MKKLKFIVKMTSQNEFRAILILKTYNLSFKT